MNKNLIRVLLVGGILLAVFNQAQAQDWLPTMTPATNWTGVASSADGSKVVAMAINEHSGPGPVYLSTNSGASWMLATNAPAASWGPVASSADGNTLIASAFQNGFVYTSTNAGINWQTNLMAGAWGGVAVSADGTIMAVENNAGGIYESTNSGVNWNLTGASTSDWLGLAMSANGAIQIAVSLEGGLVISSTNYGQTWVTNLIPTQLFQAAAVSADGTHMAVAGNGKIYTSTNTGLSWVDAHAPVGNDFHWIASSADGSRLVTAPKISFNIFTSTNGGSTWTQNSEPRASWDTVCSSADGGELFATPVEGIGQNYSIYTSQTIVPPQLNIVPAGTNLMLSWIIPSSNFVLQKSADLVSWTDMTNVPVLNLTNLKNEVCIPPASASSFFRLR